MVIIAIEVNRPEELVNTIPMLGFNIDIVKVVIAEPDPNINSVIINNVFFLFKGLYNIN